MYSPRTQIGFSLLEVLIALVVLSIGLLGHSKIQALGVRASAEANLRTQATFLVNDMMERMRANREASSHNPYYADIDYTVIDCSTDPPKICSEGTAGTAEDCTADEMADEDAHNWFCSVAATLPGGNVAVAFADPSYSIQASWDGLDEDGNVQTQNISATFIP
ncbi:MAG: type IV pilus modification protein PilV [Gammaproteobacteria bacterium]